MNTLFNLRMGNLLMAGLCAYSAGSAHAQDTPPVTLSVAYTLQNDQTQRANFQAEDQVGIAELGLLFHTIQGLQKIQLDASLLNYQYQTATQQNHTEVNYRAAWQWAVTPRLHGNLMATQQEMPKADTINGDGNVPNRQTRNNVRADAEFEIDGPWRVVAGISRDQNSSQYLTPGSADSRSDSRDVGLRYNAASGSWVLFSLKSMDGSYLTSSANDDSYQQREAELRLNWALSAASNLGLYLTQLERTHQRNTALDFSGQNYGANASWAIHARTTLVLGYGHTLAVVLLPSPLFTEQDSLSWGLNWQTSSRTQVRLRQVLQRLDYRLQNGGSSLRQDSSHDTSLTLVWTPGTQWQISAALQQQAHGSNLLNQDYRSQQVSLSARFSY